MNSVQSDIRPFVLRAIRTIAQRHSFTFMHSRQTATITTGQSSANLHARFKELTPELSPITYGTIPVKVTTREAVERSSPGVIGVTVTTSGFPYRVFLEQNDGGFWTISTGYPQTENATYTYSCFLYPADLALGTDTNGITNDAELAEACIFLAVAMALLKNDASDTRGLAAQQAAEAHIRRAISQDAHRKLSGRALHW